MVEKKWKRCLLQSPNMMNEILNEILPYVHEEKRMKTELIFEEVFTNIQKYAYDDSIKERPLEFSFVKNKRTYLLTFVDSGKAFDPASYVPDIPDENQIGGHGIRLIQKLSKQMEYERTSDNKNLLRITI